MNIIETTGLGRRYGRSWALRDCTLTIPAGHLAALVGPNGAGKTTLMNMVVGLTTQTTGTATVLGDQPPGSPAALDGIAFVAQDAPVYKNLSVADMLHLTRNLNRTFDQRFAGARLAELERVADYLVILTNGEMRLAGEVDDLLAEHQVLTGPAAEADAYARRLSAVQVKRAAAQAHLLVRNSSPVGAGWESHPVSLEELTLAYLRAPVAQAVDKEAA